MLDTTGTLTRTISMVRHDKNRAFWQPTLKVGLEKKKDGYTENNLISTVKYDGGSVMLWESLNETLRLPKSCSWVIAGSFSRTIIQTCQNPHKKDSMTTESSFSHGHPSPWT